MKMENNLKNDVYSPQDDSYLLLEAIKEIRGKYALEIGCGSGVILESLIKRVEFVIGSDINYEAIITTNNRIKKSGLLNKVELVQCNSASAFKNCIFDIVVFNPPYLPSDGDMDISVSGGKKGIELTIKWVLEAKKVLKPKGKIYFVSSSLSHQNELINYCNSAGFFIRKIVSKKLFFEELTIFEIKF